MSVLRINGISFTIYVESITQSSSMQEEMHDYYGSEPSGSASYPKFRRVNISFVIYDANAEDIARDLDAMFRSLPSFIIWFDDYNIIQGHKYVLAKPDKINMPRDTDKPNHIEGTMSIDVLGLGGDYGYIENNYVRIKYKLNEWNLEGS